MAYESVKGNRRGGLLFLIMVRFLLTGVFVLWLDTLTMNQQEGKDMKERHLKRQTDAEAFAAHLSTKLTGWKIAGTIISNDKEMWGFQIDSPNGKQKKFVWVLCDPEGNGPGFLEIQPGP